MPKRPTSHRRSAVSPKKSLQRSFWIITISSFTILLAYRFLFSFPVWFDEIIAKALLFGMPVWVYALVTKAKPEFFGFDPKRFWQGAFSGLAMGGIFAFIAQITGGLSRSTIYVPTILGTAVFWNEFGLAFATALWESLFFYGFVLSSLERQYKDEWRSVGLTTLIFLVFHLPILLLRGNISMALVSLLLLAFFAFGQGVIFLRTRSIASVIISHAFWGMALLVYMR